MGLRDIVREIPVTIGRGVQAIIPQTAEEALEFGAIPIIDPETGEFKGAVDIFGAVGGIRQVAIKLSKKALQQVARTTSRTAIFNILKKGSTEVSDDVLKGLSRELERVSSTTKIQSVVQNRLTGLVPKVKSLTPKELQSLAKEAR